MSATKEVWFAFAAKLYDCGVRIFDGADISGVSRASDPKFIAMALLARTLSNFDAALELLKQGYIVEARTITRCCYENMFWIGGLQASGSEFVKLIQEDEAASRKRRGKWLLDWRERKEAFDRFDAEKVTSYIEELEKLFPKPQLLKFANVANSTLLKDGYIFYSQLSSDAAHPSASSLQRYIDRDEDKELRLRPDAGMRATEVVETIEYACNALLGVSVGANELAQGSPAGKEPWNLADEYQSLSNRTTKLESDKTG